jgi:hypothetical protein
MALALMKPDRNHFGFFLTDLKKVKHLRIDPQHIPARRQSRKSVSGRTALEK